MMKKKRAQLQAMWQEYKNTADAALRGKLIEAYLPLVRYTAERLKHKLPMCVDINDMMAAGSVGLINAVDKFDPDRGILFETFCSMRIRGAVLDDLRVTDWVPRLIRQKAHRLDKARSDLAFELGRDAEDNEVAARMGLKLDEYYDLLKEVDVRAQLSFEGISSGDADEGSQRMEMIKDPKDSNPLETLSLKEVREVALSGLSTKERRVIEMYYFDNMTMKEIGGVLAISESRVCQIHSSVLKQLKGRFEDTPLRRVA